MGLRDFLFGKKDKIKKYDLYNPQQKKFFSNFMQQLQGMQGQGGGLEKSMNLLQDYLNPESNVYKNFEEPYMRQFNEKILPQIAERYAGAGAESGALSSSGFAQSLGAAGGQLQSNLAQMKSQMQRQSIQDLLSQYNQMSSSGLNARPEEKYLRQGHQGLLPTMATEVGTAAARGLGQSLFGGGGGMGGGQNTGSFGGGNPGMDQNMMAIMKASMGM
jgi:hypothetical protein